MPRKHGEFSSVREAILATASTLFTRQGVHGTSLGDIAAEAKLSKGTLYYYYPAKDELVLTIADECLAHMTEILLSWVDSLSRDEPERPAIVRLFDSFTENEHYARLFTVLCTECTFENSPVKELMIQYRQKWKVMLELGVLRMQSRNGEIIGERAELFFTLLTGHMLQSLAGMGNASAEALCDALLR